MSGDLMSELSTPKFEDELSSISEGSQIDQPEEGQDPVVLPDSSCCHEEMSAAISAIHENSSTNEEENRFEYNEEDFPEIKGKYKILKKIGEGTFSWVYKAHRVGDPGDIVAVKRIHRNFAPHRIAKELRYLTKLQGKSNVVPLLGAYRRNDQISLIFPYCEHQSFRDYYLFMDQLDIQEFMKALLESLAFVHTFSIIHRDVKPGNFLCSHKGEKQKRFKDGKRIANSYLLVDFGLAQFESEAQKPILKRKSDLTTKSTPIKKQRGATKPIPTQAPIQVYSQHAPRGGTRGFRAPEVLLKSTYQTCVIDVWSAGVILLSFLSGRYPFFDAADDTTSLCELVALCGSEEMITAASSVGKRLHISEKIPKPDLKDLCNRLRSPKLEISPLVYDLLAGCLHPNPKQRLTAEAALQHPFFKIEA